MDVSVCICTYNRKSDLLAALASLGEILVPPDANYEIIVVDNNSTDGTADAVASVGDGMPLRCVVESRQGLSHARNRAIAEAAGRVIAFLDDDVIVEPGWLTGVVEAFRADPAPAAVGGPARLASAHARPRWWHEEFAGVAGHFDRGDTRLSSDDGYAGMIGIGANLAFHRRVFEQYGTFRPDLGRTGKSLAMGEELDLLDRLRANRETLVYDPAIVVEHRSDPSRISKRYLRRWYFRFGEWSHAREQPGAVPRLLGVSRWRFREALVDAGRWLRAVVARRSSDAFLHELRLVAFAGAVARAWTRS